MDIKIIKKLSLELDHDDVKDICIGKIEKLDFMLIFKNNFLQHCFGLNIPNLGNDVSKFHFNTNSFIDFPNIRFMCIFPNSNLKIQIDKTLEIVLEAIKNWCRNNKNIIIYGVDFLGQFHGSNADLIYKLMTNEGIGRREAEKKAESQKNEELNHIDYSDCINNLLIEVQKKVNIKIAKNDIPSKLEELF